MMLSTPSLGITFRMWLKKRIKTPLATFNSLSRDHEKKGFIVIRAAASNFQLPLSGSLAVKWEGEKARVMYLSTPSLGIT